MSCDICREDGESYCHMGLDYCRAHGCYEQAKQMTDPAPKNNRAFRRAQKKKSNQIHKQLKKRFGGRK